MQKTASTVEAAASTAGLTQFIISIVMAFSLKALWNLRNVLQVFAYLRITTNLPANLQLTLEAVHNAVNFDVLKDKAKQWGSETFKTT